MFKLLQFLICNTVPEIYIYIIITKKKKKKRVVLLKYGDGMWIIIRANLFSAVFVKKQ